MPLAIYAAVAGGESERAHAMVLLFTGISVAALTGANRLLRSAS